MARRPARPLFRGSTSFRIVQLDPLAIAAVHHRAPPWLVGEIPFDGLEESRVERLRRPVARLERRLHGVDGVAAIVPGAVLDERDQLRGVAPTRGGTLRELLPELSVRREELVEVGADRVDD